MRGILAIVIALVAMAPLVYAIDVSMSCDSGRCILPLPDKLPDGSIILPDGSIELPDGSIILPDGSIEFPDGRINSSTHFKINLTDNGSILTDEQWKMMYAAYLSNQTHPRSQQDGELAMIYDILQNHLNDTPVENHHSTTVLGFRILEPFGPFGPHILVPW